MCLKLLFSLYTPYCTSWPLSHNPAPISQMFDVYHTSVCFTVDSASGPVSGALVCLWAWFLPPSMRLNNCLSSFFYSISWLFTSPFSSILLGIEKMWHWSQTGFLSHSIRLFLPVFSALSLLLCRDSNGHPVRLSNWNKSQFCHGSKERSQTDTDILYMHTQI